MSAEEGRWTFEQYRRPSYHSAAVLASHAVYSVTVWSAWCLRRPLEFVSLVVSATVSLLYHVCDENIGCAFGWDIAVWHALDVWSTYFLICFVLGVTMLRIQDRKRRFAVRALYFILVTCTVAYDRSSMILSGALLLSISAWIVVRNRTLLRSTMPWDGMATTPQRRENFAVDRRRSLILSLVCLTISLGFFVTANTPIVGRRLHDPLAGPKPMHVPDTTLYWFFHALWHVGSGISVLLVLRFATA
jgi:hypothetical protein